jgi:hypothetical protein
MDAKRDEDAPFPKISTDLAHGADGVGPCSREHAVEHDRSYRRFGASASVISSAQARPDERFVGPA